MANSDAVYVIVAATIPENNPVRKAENVPLAENYPALRECAMTNPWDPSEILRRANDEAQRRWGKQLITHLTDSGFPEGPARPSKLKNPTLQTLEHLANVLNWTLPRLLGISSEPELDERRLHIAARMADEIVGLNKSTPDECASAIASAYRVVVGIETAFPGEPLTEDRLRLACATLRSSLVGRKDKFTS